MGGWRWGYPRGHRRALVEYRAVPRLSDGELVWRSHRVICDGITAANEPDLRADYPEAWAHPVGSIHHDLVSDQLTHTIIRRRA